MEATSVISLGGTTQHTRTPTSDARKDANDMDSYQMDLTQRSGAHRH